MAAREVQVKYRDEDGEYATHSYWITGAGTPASNADTLQAALQGVTGASVTEYGLMSERLETSTPTADVPYDIRDKAILIFKTVAGAYLKVVIPAPLEAIFTDSEVVNSGHALVVAVKNAVIGYLGREFGDLAETYIKGYRDYVPRGK